jgi:hypothetical protein
MYTTNSLERLMSSEPLTRSDICQLHHQHPNSDIVNALYRATNSQSFQNVSESTVGAEWIIDTQTQGRLFISKGSFLQEHRDFSVPEHGGTARERLYYLMDTNHFAGVPPTFLVKDIFTHRIGTWSWQLAVQGEIKLSLPQDYVCSFRKCLIHQIRTVNLDPSYMNILLTSTPHTLAIPIDGGYSLPFAWKGPRDPLIDIDSTNSSLRYAGSIFARPKLEEPFSPEEITHIQNSNLEQDGALLQTFLSGEQYCSQTIRICKIANLILKEALRHSTITLHDVRLIYNLFYKIKWVFAEDTKGREEGEIKTLFTHAVTIKNAVRSLQPPEISETHLQNVVLSLLKNFPSNLLPEPKASHPFYKSLATTYILGSWGFSYYSTLPTNKELYEILREL